MLALLGFKCDFLFDLFTSQNFLFVASGGLWQDLGKSEQTVKQTSKRILNMLILQSICVH